MLLVRIILHAVLALSSLTLAVRAISYAPVRQPSPTGVQLAWDKEPWTGDDKPYQAIRADIDSLAATGRLTEPLIDQYRLGYEQSKADPHIVFRYAYAFYRGKQLQPPLNPRNVMSDVPFETAPSPHAYNYDRIRFLANAAYASDPQFAPIAKRLLKHDPQDYDVETSLVNCLRPWKSAAIKQEALGYADDLVRSDPDKQNAYSSLAYVYFSSWMVSHNQPDAQAATAAYRKCIKLLPVDNPRRAFLESRIKYIQDRTPQ